MSFIKKRKKNIIKRLAPYRRILLLFYICTNKIKFHVLYTKKQMKKNTHFLGYALVLTLLFLLMPSNSEARARIPVGTREIVDVVYRTPEKDSIYQDDVKLDIARYYKLFDIAYILPLYVVNEPKLVFYNAESDMIYEPTTTEQEKFLNEYLKEKGLNKEELTKIGWYQRWGGKAVFILILALGLGGSLLKNKDEIKEPTKL